MLRKILASLLLLALSSVTHAVTHVSTTNFRDAQVGWNTDTNSFSCTISSNADRVAAIRMYYGDADQTGVSVTVGGVGATLARRSGGSSHATEIWVAIAPPSGSQTVAITVSSAGTFEWWASCTELSDVDQSTPVRATAGNSGTTGASPFEISLGVSSAVGDIVLDAVAINGVATSTVGASQTQERNSIVSDTQLASYESGAAGTVTMTWDTTAASVAYSHSAASFQSPSGGGGVVINPISGRGGAAAQPVLH